MLYFEVTNLCWQGYSRTVSKVWYESGWRIVRPPTSVSLFIKCFLLLFTQFPEQYNRRNKLLYVYVHDVHTPYLVCIYLSLLCVRVRMCVSDPFVGEPHPLHCNTLQYTAVHCSTLLHTAIHYNTLQHNATHCYTLQSEDSPSMSINVQCVAVCCSVLQCVAVCCSMMQHVAACCNEL